MGFTNTGLRGEPVVASGGNPPTFAADMSGISTFFAARAFREFATVAAMVASTGSGANEWAKCDNAAGALYYSDGTRWRLGNVPLVASAAARDALFTGTCQPEAGSQVRRSDLLVIETYSGSAWVDLYSGKPEWGLQFSSTIATATGSGAILTWDVVGNDLGNTLAGAFTVNRGTGVFTCVRAGTYDFNLDVLFATSTAGARFAYYSKAVAATPTTFVIGPMSVGGAVLSGGFASEVVGHWVVPMAAGDNIEFSGLQSSGGALNITGAHVFIKQLV